MIIYEDLGLSYIQVFISNTSENSYISNIFLTLAMAFQIKSFKTVDRVVQKFEEVISTLGKNASWTDISPFEHTKLCWPEHEHSTTVTTI